MSNIEVLSLLPNDDVRNAILKLIEDKVPSKKYSLQMEQGSRKGDNFIGIVHRLNITYRGSDKDETSQLEKVSIFIKVPPENLIRRQQFAARPCFLREALIYEKYLPLLTEYQKIKGIMPVQDGFDEFATCYKTITDDLHEAIFLEDLISKGFTMLSRFEIPSIETIKLVMKVLGKLHALSFAIKDNWPDRIANYKELEDVFTNGDEAFTNFINSLDQLAFDALLEEGDEEYHERIKEFLKQDKLFEHMKKLLNGSRAEPYAVVCHGDCWNNNILFKFENGIAKDAKLIDWQLTRYASPVTDLMHYIFSCTDKLTREKYYEEILDVYYFNLATFLRRLGSDPERLFPRTAFDDQLKKFGSFALVMGLNVIPTIALEEKDIPDLDELSAKMEAGDEASAQGMQSRVPSTMSRIRDVIVDVVELGYI